MSTKSKRRRIVAAKVESAPGTVEALAAANCAIIAWDASIQPTPDLEKCKLPGSMSNKAARVGATLATMTFTTDLIGGATLPMLWDVLMRGCGLIDTSGVFTPSDLPPEATGAKTETLTLGLYQDGKLKRIAGAMGNAVFKFAAGKPATVEFTFTGIWQAPTDTALPTPTFPTTAPLKFVSSAMALGSWTPRVSTLEIDLGNGVFVRPDSRSETGLYAAIIKDRNPTAKIDPESTLVADAAPYADLLAATEAAFSIALGTTGNGFAFSATKAQIANSQEADRDDTETDDIELQFNTASDAGQDEFSMTIT